MLDTRNRWLRDGRLLTSRARLLRLGPEGPATLAELQCGTEDARAVRLGSTLLDAGAAHPCPDSRPADDVTVVVPVKDRSAHLDRCLSTAGADVLVVDDGSSDAAAVEEVCRARGARLVHRANGGPAAARNTAIPLADKEFVAFLDSDCVAPVDWLSRLRGHFDDPSVVAVAPRVMGGPRSPLDLGPHPARVRPGTSVAYVPTAALIVRRSALESFDETLRYGEDVDLVWRMCAAGLTVRYDPSVVVDHAEPTTLRARLERRYRYGTSAAALSRRHPDNLTHLVLSPWPTALLLLLLLRRRPVLAAAAAGLATARVNRQVHDVPTSARLVAGATTGTAAGIGRALALVGPLAWWAAAKDRRAALLLLGAVVQEWWERQPAEDPARYGVRVLLDQAAYGAGVIAGCVRERTPRPLVPRIGQ